MFLRLGVFCTAALPMVFGVGMLAVSAAAQPSSAMPPFEELIMGRAVFGVEDLDGYNVELIQPKRADGNVVVVNTIRKTYHSKYGVGDLRGTETYAFGGSVRVASDKTVTARNLRPRGNFPSEVGSELSYDDVIIAVTPHRLKTVSVVPSLRGFDGVCPCSVVTHEAFWSQFNEWRPMSPFLWSHKLRWNVGESGPYGYTEMLGLKSSGAQVGLGWKEAIRKAESSEMNSAARQARSQQRSQRNAEMAQVISDGLSNIAQTVQQVTAEKIARKAERQRQEEERQRVVAEQQAQSAAALAASNQALADSNRRLAEQQRAANLQQQSATQQQQSARLQTIGQQQMAARQTSSQSSSSSGGESRNTASYSFMGRSSMRLDQGYSVWDLSITNHTNRELQCRVQVQGSMYGVQNRGPGPYPRGLTNSIAQSDIFSPGQTKRYSVVASAKGSWAVSGCTVFRTLDRMPNVPLHRITVDN